MQTTTPRRADRHAHHDRPRRLSLLILFLALAGLAAGLVMASRYYEGCKGAADGPVRDVTFTVEEGATAEQVVDDLAAEPGDPVRRLRREPADARHREVGRHPRRHLHPRHRHDPRRGGHGAHDAAEEGAHGRRAHPARLPPHPDRRRGRGGARHPGRRVPGPRGQGHVRRGPPPCPRGRRSRGSCGPRPTASPSATMPTP